MLTLTKNHCWAKWHWANWEDTVKACVRVGHAYTDYFDSKVGLKQGCILSPQLFALYINELADAIDRSGLMGTWLGIDRSRLHLLMFADDIVLFSNDVKTLQKLLDILREHNQKWGLSVNLAKTKDNKNYGISERGEIG